ncbi:phosphoenolpyruvate--protein phosphotransferase [Paludibacterium purpuratum]|uniref:phosphoenolpyruvate--protein phosphotransferase n=1 Tax=Paludibacterium purpuratum TaxID=1144873 RepID=A0A4R7BCX0_9NEIS|nr:phosphoenolpyruvate--protein phosphotransferase [Paludibacterium purpuratum]TDR81586.1 phosphocarrier protein HPr /phosphoenolpyruvate--protein phosphotransferase /PTS system IIA component (Glc family) [Paludibacterium purpuratum]
MGTSELHQELILNAPLSGMLLPLSAVPDPVFAEKMIGDGIAISPASNMLRAPCAGTITHIHSARHALTLTSDDGIEILMHIGLDTVDLKGQGFTTRVNQGDRVNAGDALIEFDDAFLATHARSLITPIVILTGDKVAAMDSASGHVVAGRDRILTLSRTGEFSSRLTDTAVSLRAESPSITVVGRAGLHARPCAVLAHAAKQFKSDIKLICGSEQANAKSVVALLGLNVRHGDVVRVVADGEDAQAAIEKLTLLAAGDAHEAAPESQTPEAAATQETVVDSDPNLLRGVGASAGIAVGQAFILSHQAITLTENGIGETPEREALQNALAEAHTQLEQLKYQTHGKTTSGRAEIFAAHQELLEDPDLLDMVMGGIANGKSAAFAWKQAFTLHAERLSHLPNPLLAARANDLRDVGLRVLQILTGSRMTAPELPANTILIAEDLTPSLTVSLDRSKVLGFCTSGGSSTSHVAILARSLDIPAVVGIDRQALQIEDGTPLILDGSRGTLRINPTVDELSSIRTQQQRQAEQREADLENAAQPACTSDGHRVEVVANIGGLSDAEKGMDKGAEGVGLLRSEFLFLQREDAPGEAEQADAYMSIARAVGHSRPLVIRTLDVGGDKPLAYLPMPAEENPFLGVRGVRLSLAQPDIMKSQLRAILRAAPYAKLCIMFPMIATLDELRECKAMVEEERKALNVPPVQVGIMIEVPSAAIMAEQFAREVDFFSIGTNDLTQYVLAMDRNHPGVGRQADALNPAVLQLMASTVQAAHRHGKWVGVCGGLASDPLAVPVLVGMGVDELSVSVPSIPEIKALVRKFSKTECEALAAEVLTLSTASEVRARLTQAIKE